MECKICNSSFYIKRGLLDLFNTKKEYICNSCYKKYQIDLSYEKVYLEDHELIIVSLFKKFYRINYNAYINEYSKIFNSFLDKGYHIIFQDYVYINDYSLEIFNSISKLIENDILLIALYSKK